MINSKVAFILGISLFTFFASCTKKPCGSGTVITKELTMPSFNSITNKTVNSTIITQGATPKVEFTGYSYLEENLNVFVSDQTLTLDYTNIQEYCSDDYSASRFDITMPNIGFVEQTGTGNVIVKDFHNQGDITLLNSGTGYISINKLIGTQNLKTTIDGTGDIIANERLDSLKNATVMINGTGNFNAFAVEAEQATITITGTGNCQISVKSNLVVNIEGTGNVYYKGNPTITQNITGTGKLINAN